MLQMVWGKWNIINTKLRFHCQQKTKLKDASSTGGGGVLSQLNQQALILEVSLLEVPTGFFGCNMRFHSSTVEMWAATSRYSGY